MLIDSKLSEGHGKILASLAIHQQIELAERAAEKAWTVRKLEMEAKKLQQSDQPNQEPYSDANLKKLEIALSEHIGNRVNIEYEERGGGYLQIRFNNIDELEGHFNKIGFKEKL